jgi:hypothetical protein
VSLTPDDGPVNDRLHGCQSIDLKWKKLTHSQSDRHKKARRVMGGFDSEPVQLDSSSIIVLTLWLGLSIGRCYAAAMTVNLIDAAEIGGNERQFN